MAHANERPDEIQGGQIRDYRQQSIREREDPQRLLRREVLNHPKPKCPQQRRIAWRVDGDKDNPEQHEVRPGRADHDLPAQADLKPQDQVGEDEIGEPTHKNEG